MVTHKTILDLLNWNLDHIEETKQELYTRDEYVSLLMDRYGPNYEKKIIPLLRYLKGKKILVEEKSVKTLLYRIDLAQLRKVSDELHKQDYE